MTEKIITTLGELEAFITHNKIVLIYFHKVECNSCVKIGPYVREEAHKNGLALARVDIDQTADVALKYNIEQTPTFVIVTKDGEKLRKSGGSEHVVHEFIQKALQHE